MGWIGIAIIGFTFLPSMIVSLILLCLTRIRENAIFIITMAVVFALYLIVMVIVPALAGNSHFKWVVHMESFVFLGLGSAVGLIISRDLSRIMVKHR